MRSEPTSAGTRRAASAALAAGIVALVALLGAPARATPAIVFTDCRSSQPQPSPTFSPPSVSPTPSPTPTATPAPTPPSSQCTPSSGQQVSGTQTLKWSVFSDRFRQTKSVSLQILADEKGIPDAAGGAPLFSETYTCGNAPTNYSYVWDTRKDTPYNGKYKIVVTATTFGPGPCGANGGSGQTATATRPGVIVNNPPSTPSAPNVVSATTSSVTLAWDPATEPDVTSYTILRARTSSKSEQPAQDALRQAAVLGADVTSYRDDDLGTPGVYWYALVVTRRSGDPAASGISSEASPLVWVEVKPQVTPSPGRLAPPGSVSSSFRRYIPLNPVILPKALPGEPAPPDAPFSVQLPYNSKGGSSVAAPSGSAASEPGSDPRAGLLPVAVGAFLVSAALALGRMPY